MSERSRAGAALAGSAVLLAVPLGVFVIGPDAAGALFESGGFWTRLVVPVAVLAACAQALLVMRGDAGLAAPLAPLLPLGTGAYGFFQATSWLPAVGSSAMLGLLYDAGSRLLAGMFCAAALWLGQAAGLLVAAPRRTHPASAVSAAAALGLGAWVLFEARRAALLREVFGAAVAGSPFDAAALGVARFERLAFIAGLAGLGVFGLVVVLTLRAARQRALVAAGVAGFALCCALGARALELYTVKAFAAPPRPAGELAFASLPTRLEADIELDAGGRRFPEGGDFDGALRSARGRASGWNTGRSALIVRLFETTRLDALRVLLREAAAQQIDDVVLVGRTLPLAAPPSRFLSAIATSLVSDASCAARLSAAGPAAGLDASGVTVDGHHLDFVDEDPPDVETPRVATLEMQAAPDVLTLARAILTLRRAGYETALVP